MPRLPATVAALRRTALLISLALLPRGAALGQHTHAPEHQRSPLSALSWGAPLEVKGWGEVNNPGTSRAVTGKASIPPLLPHVGLNPQAPPPLLLAQTTNNQGLSRTGLLEMSAVAATGAGHL